MPSNKIGKLKAGAGLRRILAQRRGQWRGTGANLNYEVGAELFPEHENPDRKTRAGRWSGQN